ncbi:MAG: GNAT family N-acetyltransferase [Methanomicrobiales archaeon]|nr:GNAT family N-acetyltransferase [Methanomicrobiales archaeon]
MFRRVLVGTDFSRYADRILECIGQIPGMEEILLLHVLITPDRHAQPLLEEKGRHLTQTTGVPVRTILVEGIDGDTAGAIIKTANSEGISLIVVGARGKSILGKMLLGSVSTEVVKRAGTDVLVMHFPGLEGSGDAPLEKFCRNVFSHVLCPLDFSKPSEKTREYLKRLTFIKKVTFLHVIREGEPDPTNQVRAAELRLKEIAADIGSPGMRVESIVRSGNPAPEISRVAEEQDVSLILIGRYGKSDYASNIPLGRVVTGVTTTARRPLLILSPHISLTVIARELRKDEFARAEHVWLTYHQQKADPETDRIFGVWVEGVLVAVARCRRHPDGLEVDGVYVLQEYRDRGYARKAVQALVGSYGSDPLYMHSTLDLVTFYRSFGFEIIPESALPVSIRKRFEFAGGNLDGSNVSPMRRPGLPPGEKREN